MLLLALLLAPIGMMGRHAAMAADDAAPTAAGHCAGMDMAGGEESPDPVPAKSVDCVIACACLPPSSSHLAEPMALTAAVQLAPAPSSAEGVDLQADPPPPRLS